MVPSCSCPERTWRISAHPQTLCPIWPQHAHRQSGSAIKNRMCFLPPHASSTLSSPSPLQTVLMDVIKTTPWCMAMIYSPTATANERTSHNSGGNAKKPSMTSSRKPNQSRLITVRSLFAASSNILALTFPLVWLTTTIVNNGVPWHLNQWVHWKACGTAHTWSKYLLFRAIPMNLLLWGCEALSMGKSLLDKLEIFLHCNIRQILCVTTTRVKEECIKNGQIVICFMTYLCITYARKRDSAITFLRR